MTVETELNMDNQSAIALMKNGILNKRSKHIDVKYRFVHDLVKSGVIKLKYCATNEQSADIFTKPLNASKFVEYRNRILTN